MVSSAPASATGLGNTVTVITLLVTGCTAAQVALPKTSALTWSLLRNVLEVNVVPKIPTATPLTFHRQAGEEPPLLITAVKDIDVPWQIEVPDELIVTSETI